MGIGVETRSVLARCMIERSINELAVIPSVCLIVFATYRVERQSWSAYQSSDDWNNDFRLPVTYGKSSVALANNRHKTHNSKGEMVCIEEVDYREDAEPTHIIIQISAGSMAPFTGCPGNIVWCDNIRLAYDSANFAQAK